MVNVIYVIEIQPAESAGLSIIDVKIGITTTNIDYILQRYTRLSGDVELLNMWRPNPE
jgi:hypothetical protein